MFNLNFLMPLKGVSTKTFYYNEENVWKLKQNYKAGKYFKGFECPVNNLDEAYKILEANQEYNCFMIHGAIIDGTNKQNMIRRKRSDHKDGLKPTITDRNLSLFCLDVDGFDCPGGIFDLDAIKYFIETQLPDEFQDADYIYQYSSSYGLLSNQLKCHIFFWLDEPVHNLDIREWIKNSGIKVLDSSVLNAAQPVYIQRRICENREDPVKKFIGCIKKSGPLKWTPEATNKIQNRTSQSKSNFDLTEAIEKILTAERYHDTLNGVALSLINKKVPPNTVKAMLKGAMNVATNKDARWKERYDDIDRSVDSAVDIVNNPTIDEVLKWIEETNSLSIQADFADRCLHLSPIDRKIALEKISEKTDFGIRVLQQTLKLSEDEYAAEQARIAKEAKTEERKSRGIYEIESLPSNNGECAEKAGNILAKSEKKPEVFVMGGNLASIVISQPKTIQQCSKYANMGRDYPKMPIISAYKKPFYTLSGRLEKDVVFINDKGNDISPNSTILHIIGEANNQKFKPLTGVVEHPFIDKNWNLVQKPGYNKKTGLYTVLHHKLKLCKMDPRKAFDYLVNEVFAEFPFSSDLDKAVAVSALCTSIQRPTIAGDSGMPGFGIVSPTQSSGKTTLAQLLSYSIYNRPVAAQSWTEDEEEMGKHLLGIFQEGHSCVLFDNIQQGAAIQSGRLANAMSNDIFGGRQLGENKIIQVPSSVVWLFTGNGISFVGDFATRIYPININPKMEAPDTRNFKRQDIGKWAMDNRKKTISAVLSVIYAGKGMDEIGGSTRFKEWDEFVRRPIFKISGIDINQAIRKNQKEDMTKLVKANLIHQLHETFQSEEFTTKEAMNKAFGSFESGDTELGDAIKDVLGNKYRNTMSLGRYMGSLVDNVFDNLVLNKFMSNMVKWRIDKIGD